MYSMMNENIKKQNTRMLWTFNFTYYNMQEALIIYFHQGITYSKASREAWRKKKGFHFMS